MSRLFHIITILSLFVVGLYYHAHGMNDWFTPQTVQEGVTLAQATNEIIASMLLCTGILMLSIWENRK